MNRQLLAVVSAIALTSITSGSLFSGPSAIAQSTNPVNALFEELGDRCNRATETSYRSQVITAPDGRTSAYAAGLLRKLVSPVQAVRQTDRGYCFSSRRETLNRQIVISNEGGDRQVTSPAYSSGYVISQPQSFSADSRYVVIESRIGYTGGDAGSFVFFVDVSNNNINESLRVCEASDGNSYYQSYLGFSTPSEVVIDCNAPAALGYLEALDLQTGSVRRLASKPANLVDYGTVESEFRVVRSQLFR